MNIQLQENYKTNGKAVLISKIEPEQEITKYKPRKQQPLVLFFLVLIMELITIFLSILLIVIPKQHKSYVYLTYIVMTCVRCVIFLVNSIYLAGLTKKLVALYFLLDNVILMMIHSDITYIFLNDNLSIQNALGAITCYPILLFFLTGNFRVMMRFCRWKRWQVILYKLVKIIGCIYFLVYGCYLILYAQTSSQNKQILLLWIFTTCAFWSQMYFTINALDLSDNCVTKYMLRDQQQ